ncbi:unnamed protein product [Didymodactylos carnosus]|uniref:Uncharacterized protein n=1 Tax=Didymodactylos carnosus TaxID=1234261 RepID=A0A8S2H572_9BILA|nr:unnamed protein product [Didymodactylos carnosus]CAF3600968.1 unnamed protein product [Didymodactylos carnosus]
MAKHSPFSFIISVLFSILILFWLYFRSKSLTPCIIPFIYALLFYDLLQLSSILVIKYNIYTKSDFTYGLICRFVDYVKSSAESGSLMTLILLFIIRRKQIRYYYSHYHLDSSTIYSKIIVFFCLLFIVYIHNWLTHLKEDNIFLVKYIEDNQHWHPYIYLITKSSNTIDIKFDTRVRFLNDLYLYAQEKSHNYSHLNSITILPKNENENMIVSSDKGSMQIFIKFPISILKSKYSTTETSTIVQIKSKIQNYNNSLSNITNVTDNIRLSVLLPSSYRVLRCTYYQPYLTLIIISTFLHSIFYFILIIVTLWKTNNLIYLTIRKSNNIKYLSTKSIYNGIQTKKQSKTYLKERLNSIILSKRTIKSRNQHRIIQHLLQLKYLLYIHTFFILLRLIYVCILNMTLFFSLVPFSYNYLKFIFQLLFILSCYSIPLRIISLVIYLLYQTYSHQLTIIYYYLTQKKLKFSCQCEKVCLKRIVKIELAPFINNTNIHTTEKSVIREITEEENLSFQIDKINYRVTELRTNIERVERVSNV